MTRKQEILCTAAIILSVLSLLALIALLAFVLTWRAERQKDIEYFAELTYLQIDYAIVVASVVQNYGGTLDEARFYAHEAVAGRTNELYAFIQKRRLR